MLLSKTRDQLRLARTTTTTVTTASTIAKKRKHVPIEDETITATLDSVFASQLARDDLNMWQVDSRLIEALEDRIGVERFFSLQHQALKMLLQNPSADACISARTGSGKTLMYAIPLIHALSQRIVIRLRGLVIVPSRDLADQVFQIIDTLGEAVNLKTCCVTGQRRIREEIELLTYEYLDENCSKKVQSKIDILVATPGRLVDHIERGTLNLEHLEVLIVDEADRLLSQSYQDWLEKVYAASHVQLSRELVTSHSRERTFRKRRLGEEQAGLCVLEDSRQAPRLRRILCSATLTKNPQKLSSLALDRPLIISESEEASALPSALQEEVYWVSLNNKPAVLLYLVKQLNRMLIFASSIERAERVVSLLKFHKINCDLLSAKQTIKQRSEILNKFKSREVQFLVASDVVARGIDVENLECVLSYDCPQKAKTYVHRAGRTARANKTGLSIVLCRKDQARHFREIKSKLNSLPPQFVKIDKELLKEFRVMVNEFTGNRGEVIENDEEIEEDPAD